MFERIISKKLAFPSKIPISNAMKDLIIGCLQKNPADRLNFTNVRKAEVFKDIDWERVRKLEDVPPFKPTVTDPLKAENFDTDFTKQEARLSIVDEKKMSKLNNFQDDFNDFNN